MKPFSLLMVPRFHLPPHLIMMSLQTLALLIMLLVQTPPLPVAPRLELLPQLLVLSLQLLPFLSLRARQTLRCLFLVCVAPLPATGPSAVVIPLRV